MNNREFGRLFVIAGPSGAGKTTLAHHLVNTFCGTQFSVSTTTRSPRGTEAEGKDYCFVTPGEFNRLRESGYFLEWAEVHGNFYGTSSEWVKNRLHDGENVVLDIDVQGAVQVRQAFPGAVLVFVLPPTPGLLESRLIDRSTDTDETVRGRMMAAALETRWLGVFDYFIRNDNIRESLECIEALFCSERIHLGNMSFPSEARLLEPGIFDGRKYWADRHVVVTAGPTRERIDDVRFISNRSSGLMGYCLAAAFRDAGSTVTLISGPCGSLVPPGMIELVRIESAAELQEAVQKHAPDTDLLAMVAAVSDYAPDSRISGKTDRSAGEIDIHLRSTPDILAGISRSAKCPEILAFALEFGPDSERRASEKMLRKGAGAIFLNRGDVQDIAMEASCNAGLLMFSDGTRIEIPLGAKRFVAEAIVAGLGRHYTGAGK